MKNLKQYLNTLITKIQVGKKRDKPLVVLFANYNYIRVLDNWLVAADMIGIDNYLIISLDEKLHNHLQSRNIQSLPRYCELDLGKLWVHRVDIIAELLQEGHDIIHTDADAVWLKDPLPYLSKIHQDMIFSQGTHWPADIHKEWGFVLCCGFFYIKNTSSTTLFVKKLQKRVRLDKDDQISCNRLLLDNGLVWEKPKSSYNLAFRDKQFNCYREIINGKTSSGLSIALLPHHMFQRLPQESSDIYIKHLISEKNSDNIMDILEVNNCKFI